MPAAVLACDACKKMNSPQPLPGQHVVEYDLHISSQQQQGHNRLTINGGIPGPTLRFQVGDFARIRVHNHLSREETSTHWHGLLLPNAQDGVPHVTTPVIPAGGKLTFQFHITHSGTYWYHSHTELQEQSGVYGGIVIAEPKESSVRDEVLILSDWTHFQPKEVMRMLMRGSDYFGLMRRNSQSILGAWQSGQLGAYFQREWDRMMPMDVSDVGYHAFLINGQRSALISGQPGERVRLRIINASAATYYHLTSSLPALTIVAADGPAVQPVDLKQFLIGIAETYDLMLTVPSTGRHELRFTAQDGSGHVSAFIGHGAEHAAESPPRPNLYAMDEMLNLALEEEEPDPQASLSLPRPGSPYRLLRATTDTRLPPEVPRRKITLHLTGDMNRYVWGFDNKTIAQDPLIMVKKGEVIQLELINDTMMHHPIHLHGHFFRLLMGQGKYSPLKHTVDVPPMSKRTLEFHADDAGSWMFHCHILYHLMSGMARVFQYEKEDTTTPQPMPSLGEHGKDMGYLWGAASLQSHMSEGSLTWMNPKNDLMLNWEIGWQHGDYEVDALYQRYFHANFQAFVGYRFTNDEEASDRALAGINYRLPLMAWANLSLDSEGAARITLAKRFQLTPRLGIWGEIFYDTYTQWEWTAAADYTLSRRASLMAQYHSEHGLGAGVLIRF
jgi:FtsP/CotA-like multicopper oxidase with cupredoxin domain